jgi:hypothetical protein
MAVRAPLPALGADYPEVANTLNDLALTYRNQRRYDEA